MWIIRHMVSRPPGYELVPENFLPDAEKDVNDVCKDCLFWKQFKEGCWVYWHKKKFCTVKVSDSSEYDDKKMQETYKIPAAQ